MFVQLSVLFFETNIFLPQRDVVLSTLLQELRWILLLDYKFIWSKYNINSTRFVELEVSAIGKYVLYLEFFIQILKWQ